MTAMVHDSSDRFRSEQSVDFGCDLKQIVPVEC